jgi:hypothetical protein
MKHICWIALLALAQSCLLFGDDDEYARRSLAGLTGVDVVIENLSAGADKLGLTKEAIQTDVELKLRLAGMQIVASSSVYLWISVTVTKSGNAADMDVELHQPVGLVRDLTILTPNGSTWSEATLLANPTAAGIRNIIKDLVDSFLNAWLSVNPKK